MFSFYILEIKKKRKKMRREINFRLIKPIYITISNPRKVV